jgi:beta-galactosidase
MGTEVASTLCTRGIYADDAERGYVNAYDRRPPRWGATAETWWTTYVARPWVAGGFVWTGFDYRGEPTPYAWPCISSHFGIMDTCGFPKDNYYYYQSWWRESMPVLHLFPHWTWPGKEGEEIEVWCHTNLNRVELFVNGRSAGAQDVPRQSHAVWKVPYAPGAIEVRGSRNGQQVLTAKRETTGAPARLVIAADRDSMHADREDVAVFAVTVLDDAGRAVPVADNEISFAISGPASGTDGARIIGVGNGDPSSHEPDKAGTRRAFNGQCVVIVQAGTAAGALRVDATSPGLGAGSATVTCAAATPRPAVS